MQKLLGNLRRAVTDHQLISAGDHVAVGLSGGKDSMALLTLLARYRTFAPTPFTLSAVMIDAGVPGVDETEVTAVKSYCEKLEVPLRIEKTDIYQIVFETRKEANPCSLCSRLRRGALMNVCREMGIQKLALGHHTDDFLDTFLLSFFYEGRLNTFRPLTQLEDGIGIIRPLVYCREGDVRGLVRRLQLPVLHNPCPANHHTEREHVKHIKQMIGKEIPIAPERMREAILHPERYHLFLARDELDGTVK